MKELKFKVMMHGHILVDYNMLSDGLYKSLAPPQLWGLDETIEGIQKRAEQFNATGHKVFTELFFQNLAKCKLVTITLTIPESNE